MATLGALPDVCEVSIGATHRRVHPFRRESLNRKNRVYFQLLNRTQNQSFFFSFRANIIPGGVFVKISFAFIADVEKTLY